MLLVQNSVNARYQTIPYPWLVFGEKVKVNTVFIRDSSGVSDSILILFGGALSCGLQVVYSFRTICGLLFPIPKEINTKLISTSDVTVFRLGI